MRSRSARPWALLGLVGLVALNVVLIALLVLRPGPAASSAAPPVTPSPPPASESSAAPEDEAEPRPSEDDSPPPAKSSPATLPTPQPALVRAPAERIIAASSRWVAWRATVGTCEEPAVLEHSADGGATWQELPNALAPLQRIRVRGAETLAVIGGGAGCEPIYLASSTSGTAWSDQSQFLAGSWYLDPADRELMSTPVGAIATPCEPVDLAAATASGAVMLCTDGDLRVTADGGATWTQVPTPVDALAVGVADTGYVVAGPHEQCSDVIAVSLLDGAGLAITDEPACGPQDAEDAVAVAGVGGAVWLWADESVHVSIDGGTTW